MLRSFPGFFITYGFSNCRQDAIQELLTKPELFQSVKSILNRFGDVDQLLTLCVVLPTQDSLFHYEQRLNNVIGLKQVNEYLGLLIYRAISRRVERQTKNPEGGDGTLYPN